MEIKTWLNCHNKFILTENITVLSVSSDDFLHAILEVADQYMYIYIYMNMKKKTKYSKEDFIIVELFTKVKRFIFLSF